MSVIKTAFIILLATILSACVLVITGSSHKAYFEAYLDQMQDIELVNLQDVFSTP